MGQLRQERAADRDAVPDPGEGIEDVAALLARQENLAAAAVMPVTTLTLSRSTGIPAAAAATTAAGAEVAAELTASPATASPDGSPCTSR